MDDRSRNGGLIRRYLPALIVAALFGSTIILSAVGPARASEVPAVICHPDAAALRYLA